MPFDVVKAIRKSGLSIYDSLENVPTLFVAHDRLEEILQAYLVGLNLDFPLRTRSKVLKSRVCEALGYPVPASFRRTQPRFPGQNLDTYVQKANNLQIWNEKVTASRRYALIRVDDASVVTRVRVVTGEILARFDRTGTLTHKHQAKHRGPITQSILHSEKDTANVFKTVITARRRDWPGFLPIQTLYKRLRGLIGLTLPNPGLDQERNRGAELHRVVAKRLSGAIRSDSGQFPDIIEQLLEIKQQTASTVDLGLVCPDSTEPLADFIDLRHRDVRYAVFFASPVKNGIQLEHLILTTGQDFFSFFRRFEGKVRNSKLQIPLPSNFFD